MLSNSERTRLEKRESLSSEIRAVNDYRVKKKLIKWLEDASDALDILRKMPEERLKDDLSDIDVYRLLFIARYIMSSRRFMAVNGELDKPESWEALGYGISKPADNSDIARSVLIDEHIQELKAFVGHENPAPTALRLSKMKDELIDRITPDERNGITRAEEAMDDYINITMQYKDKDGPKSHPRRCITCNRATPESDLS